MVWATGFTSILRESKATNRQKKSKKTPHLFKPISDLKP